MTIELHKSSIEHLNIVFDDYSEVTWDNRFFDDTILRNPIVHMYPHSDTYDEDGELQGYVDSLFFKVDIYDTENMMVYRLKRRFDAVDTYNALLEYVRIFKDGSTMLKFAGHHSFRQSAVLMMAKRDIIVD